jgi:nucleoside-diphosphate-sugar epimerase
VRVLLTGASSFTGLWFAKALRAAGAEVVAPLRGKAGEYSGVRGRRVEELRGAATVVEGLSFGDDAFLALAREGRFDLLCHHAARVGDYRSPDFDVPGAVAENTRNLRLVLEAMRANGLKAVVATGSVFEQDEGIGDTPLRAFSPYGLSKGLSWQVIRYWCLALGLPAGKFVVANPFGAFEEPRFCAYLVNTWKKGDTAEVRTPAYLRDNVHVDLLALAYARFALETARTGRDGHFCPGGYRETQGAFAERFAAEMRPRLGLECGLKLAKQTDFAEPIVRLASDTIDPAALGWDEGAAWDGIAGFYRS